MDLDELNKTELVQKCKDYHIKSYGNISELKERIIQHEKFQKLPPFLQQLSRETPVDVERWICKECHAVGHSPYSKHCIVHGKQNRERIEYIKDYLLNADKDTDNLVILSEQLHISIQHCKSLYRQIERDEFDIENLSIYVEQLPTICCHDCKTIIFITQKNTARTWKDNKVCDDCYVKTYEEREQTWKQIQQYNSNCTICLKKKDHKDKRFHFDHMNMFDKGDTIYSMVTSGVPLEDIFKEIDKCHMLCFECHNIVTCIERKTGFMSKKMKHTSKKLNLPENEELRSSLQTQYEKIMIPMYDKLRVIIHKKRQSV